ncbi:hypothetical protein BCR36DRAFT_41705 [Piromyces finnis]|uniref:Uncharacterized protein n=1 Tax=Piromyces finnis TaxID=1754191 RepID=A0A1Y1VAZ9_9FUNG|nr:hypothetical protein BCR36DRAFT_41705 [Piromyces finnis]|eukprot:ORX51476.1 hypothetical protein BCR36DRAFT_41705 [Piromyces finnis]
MANESEMIDNLPLNFEFVVLSLFNKFKDHTFYAYLIQSILIFYAYVRGVGRNGNFWRIIYIGTLASFIGSIITNVCEIIIEKDPKGSNDLVYYILIAHESLYAIRNLVLPYINMVKVIPLLEEKERKKLKIFIGFMTVVQFIQRFNIGFLRYKKRDITMKDDVIIKHYGFSVIIISLTDIVCSMIIIKKLVEGYNIAVRKNLKISVYKYFFQSALFILIFVDFFSLIIGILSVVNSPILKVIFVPLYGLNSNIILLLTFDALIFKNDVMFNMNSELSSSKDSTETFSDMIEYKNVNYCDCSKCHNRFDSYCHSQYDSQSFSQYENQFDSQYDSHYYSSSSYQNNSISI